jgi:hypothetical protein
LGKYDAQTFDKDVNELNEQIEKGQARKPPKRKIENMNMPYLEVSKIENVRSSMKVKSKHPLSHKGGHGRWYHLRSQRQTKSHQGQLRVLPGR